MNHPLEAVNGEHSCESETLVDAVTMISQHLRGYYALCKYKDSLVDVNQYLNEFKNFMTMDEYAQENFGDGLEISVPGFHEVTLYSSIDTFVKGMVEEGFYEIESEYGPVLFQAYVFDE